VRDDHVSLGDEFCDLHPEVGEGSVERLHPALRADGELSGRELVDGSPVPLVDRLDEAADALLVPSQTHGNLPVCTSGVRLTSDTDFALIDSLRYDR